MTNTIHYFTFGPDNVLPDGTPAGNCTVIVEAPPGTRHRALFMAWLGSNQFSSEYTEAEYQATRMAVTNRVVWAILVEPVCGQCGWQDSLCKCIADSDLEG